ncbi:B12-binding domain-containing radical SAM protein [Vibrio sp. MACH09]|uniref:B12-binding domain-containing radical SAM protein n=1 Tax=Vibrio sp. MACH09 TaxID=3025122 RepID=UPI00279444EE|nr:radical SAM protein [Vibrio sp. MACH09]GLO60753.1 B12-binding domain-containing radical SAM protein [Vibrio sp. MACH09]
MKIALIKASQQSDFKEYKKYVGAPPQSIFSAAAVLEGIADIVMYDETSAKKCPDKLSVDLAVIFMSTPDAIRAYSLADNLMSNGVKVILAGLHTTFMPQEALLHAHAIIKGESDALWPQILLDVSANKMQPIYQSSSPYDLAQLNPYPTRYLSAGVYKNIWSVMVSRGCRFKCNYCTIPRFFDSQTYRPIGQVVDEIKRSGAQYIELKADNLSSDREYCLELFEAMTPLNIQWVAETNLRFADDEELLVAASKSGLSYLLVGLETPSKGALKEAAKGFNNIHKSKEYIDKLHQHNIVVDSCMLFGFDEHETDIFDQTWDYIHDVDLDVCHPVIMIPFPGTPLYQDLEQQGRILTRDWSLYDGVHAVYQPSKMSVEELESGTQKFSERYYSTSSTLARKWRHIKRFGTSMAYMLP